jgi:gamma-glutamyltranspeptidase/glutathione hydrolase
MLLPKGFCVYVSRCAIAWLLGAAISGCDARVPPQASPRASGADTSADTSADAGTGADAHTGAGTGADAGAVAGAGAAPVLPLPPPPDPPIVLRGGGKAAVRGEGGLVTSVDPHATRAGVDVLRRGGNAIDAAVAVAYALAVTHPSAGNIGGGGFMIVRLASGETHAIDFREVAPAAATVEKNTEQLKSGAFGYASAPVPGTVAGMSFALEKFGSRPLGELVAPAIDLARKGHKLSARQAVSMASHWAKIRVDPAARAVFGRGDKPLKSGDVWKQPDLARTLEAIAKEGPRAFYEGAFAQKTEKAMKDHGGLITAADLRAYKAVLRAPLRFSYRGFTVDTMPPPSMGGVAFAEIMLLLERLRAHEAPAGSGLSLHLFVESSKRAYAQRRLIGADPDAMGEGATAARLAEMLDGAWIQRAAPAVNPERATPALEIAPAPGTPLPVESPQTTHFSIVDAAGNAVSCTVTQSAAFGSKVIIPGTGVLLSNAMGAFSEAGVNTLAPGKRMSSSMTPAIVSRGGKLELVIGSPGGDTIPNTVSQVFRNVIDYGMTIDQAIKAGRVHHQWLPDKVRVEKQGAPSKEALQDLARRGHTVETSFIPLGDAKGILIDAAGVAWGFSDAREGGKAEGLPK